MNKLKAPAGSGALVKLALLGGAVWFTGAKTLYNVEGGHRAIVFNRLEGIKDKVSLSSRLSPISPPLLPIRGVWVLGYGPIRWDFASESPPLLVASRCRSTPRGLTSWSR